MRRQRKPSALMIAALVAYSTIIVGAQVRVKLPFFIRVFQAIANPVPTGVPIQTTDDAQTIINANPINTQFVVKAGIHAMQTMSPKSGDVFIGEEGAIFRGSKVITFSSTTINSTTYYQATGQTQPVNTFNGQCQTSYPRCDWSNELFVDGVRWRSVASLSQLDATGKWYFDNGAHIIYLKVNPGSSVVTTSITADAVLPSANNVTIDNVDFVEYGGRPQYGAIIAEGTVGWTIRNSSINRNHGGCIRVGSNITIINNDCSHNGQIGIVGIGDNGLVAGNQISYNNEAGYNHGWEGGGTKFVLTHGFIVENNNVHHNIGPGLWADINNHGIVFRYNTVEFNDGPSDVEASSAGIFCEISFDCQIYGNTVRSNGLVFQVYGWGAGILVAASPGVEVYNNTVEFNGDGIAAIQQNRPEAPDPQGPHEINNLYVHDNNIRQSLGTRNASFLQQTGFFVTTGDNTYFTTRNNRFRNNHYTFTLDTNYFSWNNQDSLPFNTWRTYGHDVAPGTCC